MDFFPLCLITAVCSGGSTVLCEFFFFRETITTVCARREKETKSMFAIVKHATTLISSAAAVVSLFYAPSLDPVICWVVFKVPFPYIKNDSNRHCTRGPWSIKWKSVLFFFFVCFILLVFVVLLFLLLLFSLRLLDYIFFLLTHIHAHLLSSSSPCIRAASAPISSISI